ncbi:response regulator [Siminovitchia terrae]|uniref:Response regulator n=1 Tax=Siminovitchia terrae TaxID=1914933 RepID=A0A429X0R9_SIMTE|nr:response regulator [Siminovitchia terrae]RST57042.1 response regulator [Siminovitchia terrae]
MIDKELLMLELLGEMLDEIEEVQVIGKFINPHQGLVEIIRTQPDAVFLDIEMSEISGLNLAEEIKKTFPDMNIVFVTAFEQDAVRTFKLQAAYYLVKPYRAEELIETISCLLSRMGSKKTTLARQMVCCFKKLHFKYYGKNSEVIDVKWRTSKSKALFAFLIHHRDQFIPKDMLLEYFWPDVDIKDGYSNLYSTIYQIRKTLKSIGFNITIISSESSYRLELNDVLLDVEEWKKGREEFPFVTEDTLSKHKEICNLYNGDYLEEESYLWAESKKNEMRIQWLHYLKRVAKFYISSKNYSEAIILYMQIQEALPYKEESYFVLMQLYDAFGDRYSVEEQYSLLKNMLHKEYCAEPNEMVQTWYQTWKSSRAREQYKVEEFAHLK